MEHNWKIDIILELFYEYPNKIFSVREISNKLKIPSSTVQRHLKKIRKEGLITKENKANITPYFKFRKTYFMIDKLFKYGLVEYIEEELSPSCVILFGSFRKGEYVKESDIDLFVETLKTKEIDLSKFEKKLKHSIHIFTEKDINDLPEHLLNNVMNGIKLMGYFKIK